MKKRIFLLYMGILYFQGLESNESISQLGSQAKAFAETRDLKQASQLYEKLSTQSLPDWQQALILYNWGTVKVLQQEWEAALKIFNRIALSSISSPQLLRSVTLNRAAARLGQAKLLSAQNDISSLGERRYLIWQSLKELEAAKDIDCRIQKVEQNLSDCLVPIDIHILQNKGVLALNQINKELKDQFFANLDLASLLTILRQSLATALHFSLFFTKQTIPHEFNAAYLKYFTFQMKTIEPLWDGLKKISLSDDQRKIITIAFENFTNALDASLNSNWENVQNHLQFSEDSLQKFASQSDLETLILRYRLTLLNRIDEIILKDLLDTQISFDKKDYLKQSSQFLKKAIEEIQINRSFISRFYVICALSEIENLQAEETEEKTCKQILQQALQTAIRGNELTQLVTLSEDFANKEIMLKDVQAKQHQVIQQSLSFIPNALKEEKMNFNAGDSKIACQKQPWEQVIPLFENGLLAAKQTEIWMKSFPLQFFAILNEQQKTIINWQQALKLLENSPSFSEQSPNPNPDPSHSNSKPKTSQDIQETLRLLQEMQSNDQPQKGQSSKERHSW
ncbi:hypothetical protein [Candidatus Protochlamydia amoebophila]|uniref:hypothetical protein n=1 Tax=Candidatus Protochlamydia amoebophila TaxID=362787 RepID=UPI00057F2C73|nr:hypothetical protein [Candidatus Protochlamydia amoebophila]